MYNVCPALEYIVLDIGKIEHVQPAPSMMFQIYSDPSKMVYSDPFQYRKLDHYKPFQKDHYKRRTSLMEQAVCTYFHIPK